MWCTLAVPPPHCLTDQKIHKMLQMSSVSQIEMGSPFYKMPVKMSHHVGGAGGERGVVTSLFLPVLCD